MTDDPWMWLEDVEGDEALDWVRARNAEAEARLFRDPAFEPLRTRILEVLEADDRIAYPSLHGDPATNPTVHNFWTDAEHRRGLLRRTTWEDYRAGDPTWETVLDVDALGAAEDESWVFHGAATRRPDRRRTLVDLSPGGSDASVTREFDLVDRAFVQEADGGFVRPLAKGELTWIDDDTVYVATDLGPGTLTRSGYPRTIRRWRRGTPLADATLVFEGADSDIVVGAAVATLPGARHHVFQRMLDFYTAETWIIPDGEGEPVRVDVPVDVDVSVHDRWFTFSLREDWTHAGTIHAAGSLLVADVRGFLAGEAPPIPVFTPTDRRALAGHTWTRHRLVLNVLDDVRNRIEVAAPPVQPIDDWHVTTLGGLPDVWSLEVSSVDADTCDDVWLVANDFLTPESLYRVPVGEAGGEPELLRQAPARFDAAGLSIAQHFATSADGTRVPYFEVSRDDGPRPTLLGGYGGFEVPRLPAYAPALGRAWLEAGGTYVLANIRGGGEYGPRWHQAGLRERRPRVYEDFEAVARDLVERGVTTHDQLGCTGGSNGGLLVGNMYVRSPELWGAIVCQVPLLDMRRYHLLLAGASWMAEYGDPDDPADWAFMQEWSPYHQVDPDRAYPPLLLTTSTRDDRVHPGHARKMVALLGELGKDVTYWENVEGGHGGAADAAQQATMQALLYVFLRRHLAV
ncbi:MAG TPA: prolyl oligopeptidase family serine peptidase [Acidimicrobiales bacterium]|nr:prolyl oligopeptidase family serine peptidase [Acidimicrobiales bacterium]